MFWNDPDGAKYRGAYFERFDNVWCHGDFAEWTSHDGIVIHGRSARRTQATRLGSTGSTGHEQSCG